MFRPMANGLKSLRDDLGWTQEKAATEFGMSKSGYIKLERGDRRLTDEHIAKAMQIYRVPASSVLSKNTDAKVTEPSNATIVGKTSGTGTLIPLYGQAVGGRRWRVCFE